MGTKIDEYSYSLGYDTGVAAGTDDGYTRGWQDAVEHYDDRIVKLNAEILTLEARINVIKRGAR